MFHECFTKIPQMATFKAIIYPPKADGTRRLAIQMIHQRKKKIIPTEIYVEKADLTKSGNLRSDSIKESVERLLSFYRTEARKLGHRVNFMSCDQLHNQLLKPEGAELDFFAFSKQLIDRMIKEGRTGQAGNYKTALNSLAGFIGSENLDFNDMTAKLMFDYESHMTGQRTRKQGTGRAVSLYTGIFRAILNRAKAEFNDEDRGIIKIVVSPFTRYKIPNPPPPKKRAVRTEEIRAIINIDPGKLTKRVALARDCFLLSFYLLGTNSVDLFTLPPIKQGRITYNRAKTRTRRRDAAEISILVLPEAKAIIEKYRDFSKLYSCYQNFNQAINIGLKTIGEMIGVPGLTFYAARHSWATIASNDCDIDKYTVHQALNHADDKMRVTDLYINKDWSAVDRANRKVIDFVLNL